MLNCILPPQIFSSFSRRTKGGVLKIAMDQEYAVGSVAILRWPRLMSTTFTRNEEVGVETQQMNEASLI